MQDGSCGEAIASQCAGAGFTQRVVLEFGDGSLTPFFRNTIIRPEKKQRN